MTGKTELFRPYEDLDPYKLEAQKRAAETGDFTASYGVFEISASRGESCYLQAHGQGADAFCSAIVVEALGTKYLVADAMEKITGHCYYAWLAQDTVAMVVNDMATVGAQPTGVGMLTGAASETFKNLRRAEAYFDGWAQACRQVKASWGCGETPALSSTFVPGGVFLGGAATGFVRRRADAILGDRLKVGDVMIGLPASGIHANGLTMARAVGDKEINGKPGYAAPLPNGMMFGEALLTPTPLYARFVLQALANSLHPSYIVNVTGHGWRKLMRHRDRFAYAITQIPQAQPEFAFIQQHYQDPETGLTPTLEQMYGAFNMGLGYVLMMPAEEVEALERLAKDLKVTIMHLGYVEEAGSRGKRVEIGPLDLTFLGESLQIRG